MKRSSLFSFLLVFLISCKQDPPVPFGPLPTASQLAWHEMEMYCLIHFSMGTYRDKEWGFGDEDPAEFNPSDFNALQIVNAAKAGGFKGVVVVAKHHDGFCLWPSNTTTHNIRKSPWKNGQGDIVKAFQIACDQAGMKLGIYCSPWDRHSPLYGSPEYVTVYRNQLKELYSNYGPLFMSWHDGANGGDGYYGGARESRKIDRSSYYGWDTTWALTRKLQPAAVIFGDVGPDVRWVGNEEGHAGETCWATYTPQAPYEGRKPANGYVKHWEGVEGTRNGRYWMPAECDVPLRPGWFYHQTQDHQVKTPYQLLDLYYQSVGRGACLDLGLAPDKRGLLPDEDVRSLRGFGDLLNKTFSVNLASGAHLTASNIRGGWGSTYGPDFLLDEDRYSYWATDDGVTKSDLTIELPGEQSFNVIRLRENIKLGQRIDSVAIDIFENNNWRQIVGVSSIGSNRLIRLPALITCQKLRLRIIKAAASIALSDFALFREPVADQEPVADSDQATFPREGTGSGQVQGQGQVDGLGQMQGWDKEQVADMGNSPSYLASPKSGWKISSTVELVNGQYAIDGDSRTIAVSASSGSLRPLPQEIRIDMGKVQPIVAFTYLPRQDKKTDGVADKYVYYVSNDGRTWLEVARGEFSNVRANPVEQVIPLETPVKARYYKLSVLSVLEGNSISIAELGVLIRE